MIQELLLISALLGGTTVGASEGRTNAAAQPSADEQRQRLHQASELFRNDQAALYEKLRAARRELEQAAQAENPDEKDIRARAAVLGRIEGDLAILRARHFQDLRAVHPQAAGTNPPGRLMDVRGEHSEAKRAVTLPSDPQPSQPPPAGPSAR